LHRVDGVTGLYLKKGRRGRLVDLPLPLRRQAPGNGARGRPATFRSPKAWRLVVEFAEQRIRPPPGRRERAEAEAQEKTDAGGGLDNRDPGGVEERRAQTAKANAAWRKS